MKKHDLLNPALLNPAMLDSQFNKLIYECHKLEDEVLKLLKKDNDVVVIPDRKSIFSKYDFIINNIKYEVKRDNYISKTNTMFLEIESNKKPSGITITESDLYAIKSGEKLFIIPVKDLKELIKTNSFNSKLCGYNKLSKCLLINASYINKYLYIV